MTRTDEATSSPASRRRWYLAILAFFLALLSLGAFLGWRRLANRADREEALRLAEKGEFARAEPFLKRLAEGSASDAAIDRQLALGYMRAGRFSDAEPYFERWSAANPQDPEPLIERVRMWVQWGSRLEAAIADARRVLQLQPDNRALARQLPRWLMITGRFDEADQECRRFLTHWPDDPWLLLVQALVHQRRGRFEAAVPIVDRLVRQYADDLPEAYLLRGILYLDANQATEAVGWLERAAAIQGPHRREALYELSLALARLGKKQDAERLMAQARLLQEQDFLQQMLAEGERWDRENVQLRLAEQLFQAGQSQEGGRVLARVLKDNPNSAAARQVLARYSQTARP
jgi:tetratricopeptide (TPR) repeat protein